MCKDKFDNKKDFEEHNSKVHNGIKPFICTTCGAGFSRNGNLKCHMEAVHEKKRNFSCKILGCEKQFYGKKEFLRHYSTSTQEEFPYFYEYLYHFILIML